MTNRARPHPQSKSRQLPPSDPCASAERTALTTWAQAVNRFFEPGVRLQRERGQRVIYSGPYALVRHPGNVGALYAQV